mgnify:CR=1 FL=1
MVQDSLSGPRRLAALITASPCSGTDPTTGPDHAVFGVVGDTIKSMRFGQKLRCINNQLSAYVRTNFGDKKKMR